MIKKISNIYSLYRYSTTPARLFVFAGQGSQEKGMLDKFIA